MRWRAAVGTVVLATILAGCGGGDGDSDSGSGGAAAATGEVDRDATLRFSSVNPISALDPHTTTSEVSQFPNISLVYDRLTQMVHGDNGHELAPMVAESWEFSEDGKTLTFTLRDDVTFADGSTLDAEAVRLSLERARTLPASTAKNTLAMIENVEAADATTLVITMSQPSTDLPYVLSTGYGAIINPAALDKPDLDTAPEGSGPYVVTDYRAGASITYERREGYWDPEAGLAKTVVVDWIADGNARLSALRSGQHDFTALVTQQTQEAEALGDGYVVNRYEAGIGTRQIVSINQFRPFMDDVRVRQALNYAVDREGIIDALMDGAASPINQYLGESDAGYLSDPPENYSYDPDKARDLLQEAGVPDGQEIRIVSPNTSPPKDIAAALQEQLQDVGFSVTVDYLEPLQVLQAWTPTSNYDLTLAARVGRETPSLSLSQTYLNPSRGLINPPPTELAGLLADAVNPTLDEGERTASLEEANALVNEQAYDIFIAGEHTANITTDKVIGADAMGRSDYQGIWDLRYVGIAA